MKNVMVVLLLCLLCSGKVLGQRDPLKWPFEKTSIWNLPLHHDAVYVPAGVQDAVNFEVDEDIIIMTPNEPMMNVQTNYTGWDAAGSARCAAQGPTLFSAPIPQSFIFSNNVWHGGTPNSGVAVLLPNGKIIQSQPFAKCSETVATSLYKWDENDCVLTGECITGAHGGSHLSAIGGALRVGELTSGMIRHVLKINLLGKENFYNGDGGFRWPATKADGGYNDPSKANYYGGTNPEMRIGALLALHKDVVLESVSNNSLGLETEAALIIARALRDYGAYTVDNTAWDTYGLITEIGPEGRVSDEFKSLYGYDMNFYGNPSTPWARDIKKMFTSLYVISNNSPTTVGGGPKSDLTNRRAPAAPDFLPAQTLRIMPLGDSKTEGGGGNGQQSSWRGFLRAKLLGAGYKIDYVGPQNKYADGDVLPYDSDHAGFGGYTIGPDINRFCETCPTTGLYEHLQNYLTAANPDIVLVAVGVNDMFNASVHPPNYAATAPQRYRALIKKIQDLKPGVRIIVGTIEPVKWDVNWGSNPNDNNIGALNAAIKALADSSTTDNIFFADIRNRMLVDYGPADFFDDVHLSQQGARKNADAWFDALVPVLNSTPNNVGPTVSITSPGASTTLNAPATVTIEVAANDEDGSVTKVEFYSGSRKIGDDTSAPFAFTWSNVDEGTYRVRAVATDNLYATAESDTITISVTSTDGYVKFEGTGIGSPGSYGGSGLTFHKALDGDPNTFFDAPTANGQWVGVDLGAARIVKKVRYIPRDAWAQRIVNGKIQGSNAADFSDAVDLFTMTFAPEEDVYTVSRFENSSLYQFYRFLSPANGYGNIAELEFWGDPNDPVNAPPSCSLVSPQDGTSFSPGSSVRLSATASDSDGTISRVEFYQNSVFVASVTTAPFDYIWKNVPAGIYKITAKAYDNAGVTKLSAPVTITVANTRSAVLYSENFDLNTSEGWVANGGGWVASGAKYRNTNNNGEFTSFYSGMDFTNYTYSADALASWNNDIGMVFNYQNTSNYYVLVFNTNSKNAFLKRRLNGSTTTVATNTFTGRGTGTTHNVSVRNGHGRTTVSINGAVVFDSVATTEITSGKIGVYTFYCPSVFDNVVVSSNNFAPEVVITSPSDSSVVNSPATVELTATATDSDGLISKVEFYNGPDLLGSDSESPYSFSWTGIAPGTYYVTAKATDDGGAEVTSSVMRIIARNVQESVGFDSPPMKLVAGATYTVNVTYSALSPSILDLYLYDSKWKRITSVNVPVAAGFGTRAISVTVPATTGTVSNGIWAVNLWKGDWSSVLKSATQTGVSIQRKAVSASSVSLQLTSLCSEVSSARRWRVTNSSDEEIAFSWKIYKSSVAGTGVVAPQGVTVFETPAQAGDNTLVLSYGNSFQQTKASSDEVCITGRIASADSFSPEEEVSVNVYPVPATSSGFTVEHTGFSNAVLAITDMASRVVFVRAVTGHVTKVDDAVAPGIYVLSVHDGIRKIQKKVIFK